MVFVVNVIEQIKSIIIKLNAVIALVATKKLVDKDAMVFVSQFVLIMKIGSIIDVYVNQDFILLITSVLNVLKVNFMIFIKESVELSAEQIKFITSILKNVIVLRDSYSSEEFVLNVNLDKLIMNIPKPATQLLVLESMNTTPKQLILVSVNQDT